MSEHSERSPTIKTEIPTLKVGGITFDRLIPTAPRGTTRDRSHVYLLNTPENRHMLESVARAAIKQADAQGSPAWVKPNANRILRMLKQTPASEQPPQVATSQGYRRVTVRIAAIAWEKASDTLSITPARIERQSRGRGQSCLVTLDVPAAVGLAHFYLRTLGPHLSSAEQTAYRNAAKRLAAAVNKTRPRVRTSLPEAPTSS